MPKKQKLLSLSEDVHDRLDEVEVQSWLVEDLLREEFGMPLRHPEHLYNERVKQRRGSDSEEVEA